MSTIDDKEIRTEIKEISERIEKIIETIEALDPAKKDVTVTKED